MLLDSEDPEESKKSYIAGKSKENVHEASIVHRVKETGIKQRRLS